MTVSIPFTSAASSEIVAGVERSVGYPIPPAVLRFMMSHDGATPSPNCVNRHAEVSIRRFIPSDEILNTRESVEGFPQHGIPVAEDGIGNLIYVVRDGSVFFWDHEIEDGDIRLEADIDSLIELMAEEKPLDLGSARVRNVWVRPGFKPTFK